MMMPANFSAVAENEMTYVVGGSLVDVLAPAMTTANWQNVSANVIKIVGNSFLAKYTNDVLAQLFDGNYVPGDVIGFSVWIRLTTRATTPSAATGALLLAL